MHLGCLNGTALEELKIVYRTRRDVKKSKLREIVRKEVNRAKKYDYT